MNMYGLRTQVDVGDWWKIGGKPIKELAQFNSLAGFVSFLLPVVFLLAGIISFILIVLAGFTMITSAGSGDAHASERAKNFFTYGAIGLVLILGAYSIMQVVSYLTNNSLQGIF